MRLSSSPRPLARALCAAAAGLMLAAAATAAPAAATAPSARTSEAKATYIQGVAVRASNGKAVAGVLVTVRDVVDLSVIGSDVTDSMGVYRISGLHGDEYAIKLNGRAKGFETGYLACGTRGSAPVVPTWGGACSHDTGAQDKARLQVL